MLQVLWVLDCITILSKAEQQGLLSSVDMLFVHGGDLDKEISGGRWIIMSSAIQILEQK